MEIEIEIEMDYDALEFLPEETDRNAVGKL